MKYSTKNRKRNLYTYYNMCIFHIIVNPIIHAISLSPPRRDPFNDAISDAIESFSNFVDDSTETCDDVSDNDFINIMLEITGNENILKSTVIIKGSQQCGAFNVAWFVSGRVSGPIVIPCNVTEEMDVDMRKCNLLCQCVCGDECDFLHFHVQNPPWMKQTLSLCHYEHYFYIHERGTIWEKNLFELLCSRFTCFDTCAQDKNMAHHLRHSEYVQTETFNFDIF